MMHLSRKYSRSKSIPERPTFLTTSFLHLNLSTIPTTNNAITTTTLPTKITMHTIYPVFLVLLYVIFILATQSAAAPVEFTPNVIYKLPEGFDLSHPGLDIASYVAELERNSSAVLPSLPFNILDDAYKVTLNVSTAPHGAAHQANWKRICETSEGSPLFYDVGWVAGKLIYLKDHGCCQTNSHCTHLATMWTASVSVCGANLGPGWCIPCDWVGKEIQAIGKHCRTGDKAGGIARYPHYHYKSQILC